MEAQVAIQFTSMVYDFGVKYVGEEHAKHLVSVLINITMAQKIGKETNTSVLQSVKHLHKHVPGAKDEFHFDR